MDLTNALWDMFKKHSLSADKPDQRWVAKLQALIQLLIERKIVDRPTAGTLAAARKQIMRDIK